MGTFKSYPTSKARRDPIVLASVREAFGIALLLVAAAVGWHWHSSHIAISERNECFDCNTAAIPVTPPEILVAVISKCSNTANRDLIRSTWGRSSMEAGVLVKFYIGIGSVCKSVADARDADVIKLPVHESYANLSSKTATMLMHASHAFDADVVLKVDDDIYVDPYRFSMMISAVLEQRITSSRVPVAGSTGRHRWRLTPGLYGGFFNNRTRVGRDASDKWADPAYPADFYPPYAGGGAYWLTRPVVNWIGEGMKKGIWQTGWRNEDASLGTWIAGTTFERIHDEGYLRCMDCEPLSYHQAPWSMHLQLLADEDRAEVVVPPSRSLDASLDIDPVLEKQRTRFAFVRQHMEQIHARVKKGGLIRGRCQNECARDAG